MEDFISIIRTDRKREMDYYEGRGYTFIDSAKYLLVDKIKVHTNDKEYSLGVQADAREVYFYLINEGANYYLSMADIYNLLHQIAELKGKKYVVGLLKRQLLQNRKKAKDGFFYRGIKYELNHILLPQENIFVMPDGASKSVDIQHLFILLCFIQEKSNAFFGRSKISQNKNYKNGILRLFIVLLSLEKDTLLLNNLGWFWDTDRFIYDRNRVLSRDERNGKKYYLTNDEYKNII